MKLPLLDWIWRAKGSVSIDEPMSSAEVYDRLSPLFDTEGTSYAIEGDTLTFKKDNPTAQDKLATFTSGALQVGPSDGQRKLFYNVSSPALLFCFLAPLLFMAFGQLTVSIGEYENSKPEEAAEAEADTAKDDTPRELHPIDAFLGAPAPTVLTDEEKEAKEKEDADKKHSPTTAYVLAAIFATLFAVGRMLEPWLLRRIFRKALNRELEISTAATGQVLD